VATTEAGWRRYSLLLIPAFALLAGNGYASVSNDTSAPALTFSVAPAQVPTGSTATLSWSSKGALSCSASGAWSGSKALSSNSNKPVTVNPGQNGLYTYTLSCSGWGGTTTQSVSLIAMSGFDQQIVAAQTTAANPDPNSSCGAISRNTNGANNGFYWEVGDQNGVLADTPVGLSASGSVQPDANDPPKYTRTMPLYVASASKWLYGTYVAQTKAVYYKGQWRIPAALVPFLNFTSGYENMTDYCPPNVTATVGACGQLSNGALINPVPNDTQTPGDAGKFYYNSGHLQVLEAGYDPSIAGVMNGASETYDDLTADVVSTLANANKGVFVDMAYTNPDVAGGVEISAGEYANFLQGLISSNTSLIMNALLRPTASDPYAVCTNPWDNTCVNSQGQPAAVWSPVPGSLSWHYSITHWIEDDPETGDGAYSSPGKYGFYPWIDATKTYYGIVARYDATGGLAPVITPYYMSVVCGQAIRKAFMTGVVQP
jgi:hypothetical protein